MLSVARENDWAETLLAIAGANAGNAARHFGKDSYDRGNVALAVVWSRIASAVDDRLRQARERHAAAPPVPLPLVQLLVQPAYDAVALAEFEIFGFEILALPTESVSVPPPRPVAAAPASIRKRGAYRMRGHNALMRAKTKPAPLAALAANKRRKQAALEARTIMGKRPVAARLEQRPPAKIVPAESLRKSKRGARLAALHRRKPENAPKLRKRPLPTPIDRAATARSPQRALALVADNAIPATSARAKAAPETRSGWQNRRAA